MTVNELKSLALAAFTKAKALKEEYAAGTMPADKMELFQAHMSEFAQYNAQVEEAKKNEEAFAAFNQAAEQYGQPAPSNVGPLHSDLAASNSTESTLEQRQAETRRIHTEAFSRYLKFGQQGLNRNEASAFIGGQVSREELSAAGLDMETFAHLGSVDSLGGFLVPDDFMSELIKDLAGASIMRQISRVRTTSRAAASFMTVAGSGNRLYSSGVTGSFRSQGWVQGGNNIPTQNQPRFGQERVQVHVWSPDVIEITMELLEDAALNLEAEVRELLVETRRLDEDSAFILGNGIGMPTGIHFEATQGNIVTVNSQAAAGLTYDGLCEMWAELPAQYRSQAVYLMNSKTLAAIKLIKDNENRPIFPVNEIPTNLFGRPIVVSEFMPDIAASAIPIIFGDFSNYGIADRADLRIIRLNERFAPNVGLLAVARVGGQMLRSQPFVSQTISA